MRAVDVVLETLTHFVKREGGPPPGIPVGVEPDFERKLVRLCEWHSLSPLVLDSLGRLALESPLSEITLGRLKALATASGARNERYLAFLRPFSRRMRERRVPFLLVDDISAALKLYPRHRLRPIESLDVLIHENDWSKFLGACRTLRFRRDIRDPAFHDGQEAMLYHQCFAPCELRGEKGLVVGVKFRLIDVGRPQETEAAWSLAKRLGRDIEAMRVSYEDQFVRSCLAFNMTGFGRLLHAVDAGRIIGRLRGDLDWSYIEGLARDRSFYPALYFSCEAILNMFRLSLKRRPLPHPSRARKSIFEIVWHPGRIGVLAEKPATLHRYKFCFLENGTWREKIGMTRDVLVPRREWVSGFFGRPYRLWLRLKFVVLALTNRLGPVNHRPE